MDNTSTPDGPGDDPPASPWSAFEAAYRGVLSLDRLQRYRKDRDRTSWAPMIGRYMYNVEVARALVPVLHWAEIALRNRLQLEPVFPHCPAAERTRRNVHGRYQEIKAIRNRAFHHERITHQVSVALYDRIVETVGWIDPLVADSLVERERAAFVGLLQAGPTPFVEWAARRAA